MKGTESSFPSPRTSVTAGVGAGIGFLGVAAGAFGAHLLAGRVEASLLDAFQTGARYAQLHAVVLLVLGLLDDGPRVRRAAGLFSLGVLLFSGSLWLMALTGVRALGAITPLGGLCLLAAWLLLAAGYLPLNPRRSRSARADHSDGENSAG